MNNDIQAILNRIAADVATEADFGTLRSAIQTGQVTVVTGERAVAAGGHITDTVIVTGNGNMVSVLQGIRGETIKAIVQEALSTELLAPPEPGSPPYKGLDFYDVADAPFFFGREKLTAKLIAALREHTFLTVVGDSGSGKSSLVRAGMMAVLQDCSPRSLPGSVQPPLGSSDWHYVTITPTAYPLEALVRGVAGEGAEAESLLETLRISKGALRKWAETLIDQRKHVFLLVDQFEEIFTLSRNEQERATFVAALVEASRKEKDAAPCTVVVTLRADFYRQCLKDATLREILPSGQFNVGVMNHDELKRAIQSPAENGGWVFQQSLVDQIMADAGDEPGNLPLISYALLETWRQRSGRVMTLDGYYRAGRVRQAISQTADRVFAELAQEGLDDVAQRICLALVTPDEKEGATRRGELVQTLAPDGSASRAGKALKILSDPDARLVTIDEYEVQLVHDALITAWPRLREWLRIYQEELRRVDGLRTAAAAWSKATRGQKPEFLIHRGGRLRDAQRLATGDGFLLGESVRTYIDACQEAETARQRNRFRLAVGAVLMVSFLSLLATWFGLRSYQNANLAAAREADAQAAQATSTFDAATAQAASTRAIEQQQETETQKQATLANQLAAQAKRIVDQPRSPEMELALLLSIESLKRHPTSQGSEITLSLFDFLPEVISHFGATEPYYADHVFHAAIDLEFSPDGRFIVTAHDDKTARIFEIATDQQITGITHEDEITAVAFSPDGNWVASSSMDHTARVWQANTGYEIARMTHDDGVTAVVFSPDGNWAATSSVDHTARIWEARTGQEIARMTHDDRVTTITFSPDSKWVASGSADRTARVWEASTGREISRITHDDEITAVRFSPNGRQVASSSTRSVRVWEAATGQEIAGLTGSHTTNVAFSPDGHRIASSCPNYDACVWEIATGQVITGRSFNYPVNALAFSPDGGFVISSSGEYWGADPYKDYTVNVWDAISGIEVARVESSPPSLDGKASPVAFSPDGSRIASVDWYGRVQVWRVDWTKTRLEIGKPSDYGKSGLDIIISSPDGRWILEKTGTMSNTIQVLNRASEREVTRLVHDSAVTSLIVSQDSAWVVTSSDDNIVRSWELNTGREVVRIRYDKPIRSMAISPNGQWVVSCSDDGVARVWETANGRVRTTRDNTCDELLPTHLEFSSDGQLVYSAMIYAGLSAWEASTGSEVFRILHPSDAICGLLTAWALSPDGSQMVVADGYGETIGQHNGFIAARCISASVVNALTGRELARIPLNSAPMSINLSSDGHWLVTSAITDDVIGSVIQIWDVATGFEVARIPKAGGHVEFSPDGHWVISSDYITRYWHWQTGDLIHDACSRLERNLTQVEWKSYLHDEPYRQTCPDLPVGN